VYRYKLQYSSDGVTWNDISDPLSNTYYEFALGGGTWRTIDMGPFDEGGQTHVYTLPYVEQPAVPWIFPDLIARWDTSKVPNGLYTLRIQGFKVDSTGTMLVRYFYFRTPQFVYYVIPMSVLVSTLVTIGIFTKNSELLVMRACGISLYRAALPLLICGVLASGVLFLMQERVLVSSNREADKLERTIRHWPEATTALNRRWMVGTNGEMYHYDFFDQRANRFTNLLVYRLDEKAWRLRAVTRATDALFLPPPTPDPESRRWFGRGGWTREFVPARVNGEEQSEVKYETFAERNISAIR